MLVSAENPKPGQLPAEPFRDVECMHITSAGPQIGNDAAIAEAGNVHLAASGGDTVDLDGHALASDGGNRQARAGAGAA